MIDIVDLLRDELQSNRVQYDAVSADRMLRRARRDGAASARRNRVLAPVAAAAAVVGMAGGVGLLASSPAHRPAPSPAGGDPTSRAALSTQSDERTVRCSSKEDAHQCATRVWCRSIAIGRVHTLPSKPGERVILRIPDHDCVVVGSSK
jgi:hypothetical protein